MAEEIKEDLFSSLFRMVQTAAELWADGDKSRIKLKTNRDSGYLDVFVDDKRIDRFDNDGKPCTN